MSERLPHEKGFHVSWDQIHRDARASIVVQSPTVTPALIGVQIHPTRLPTRALDQIHPGVQLSQLVVRPAPVAHDFNPIQRQRDVRRVGRPQLLTRLAS